MTVMEEKWIEILRRRFSDRKAAVPDDIWNSIEAAMAGVDVADKTAKKFRHRHSSTAMVIRFAVSAAACAVVLIGAWRFYISDDYNTQRQIKNITASDNANAKQSLHTKSYSEQYVQPTDLPASIQRAVTSLVSKVRKTSFDDAAEPDTSNRQEDNAVLSENTISSEYKQQFVQKQENKVKSRSRVYNDLINQELAYADVKKEDKDLSISVHGGSLASLGGSSLGNSSSGGMYSRYNMARLGSDAALMTLTPSNGYGIGTDADEVKAKHRQPIKVGVSMRYPLTKHLSVETGMNYSYLSSDFAAGDGDSGYKTSQKLHYIGIPLNLQYDIWHTDLLEVYASCGGAVDFCVSGKSDTEYIVDDKVTRTDHERVRDTRPQWSANLSAGVQYNIGRNIGIYAEPGVSYYFDNGSDVSTIYKDKPFNFNLNVGVRLTVR